MLITRVWPYADKAFSSGMEVQVGLVGVVVTAELLGLDVEVGLVVVIGLLTVSLVDEDESLDDVGMEEHFPN